MRWNKFKDCYETGKQNIKQGASSFHEKHYFCALIQNPMSDILQHECGIAMIRLLKPIEHYIARYGSAFYGLNKLHLLMEKQHNRGQDGAGIANIKLDMPPGEQYMHRIRSNAASPIKDVFERAYAPLAKIKEKNSGLLRDVQWLKSNVDFSGELFLGHLRYGTFGGNNIGYLHPVVRENNWITRNLVLAGNFNMTNVDELFEKLVNLGQYPIETSDTVTILEKIGHWLDEENERLYKKYRDEGLNKRAITDKIIAHIDIPQILKESAQYWDGGYVIGGMLGHGDAFVMRDEIGIRPAFYYADDEIVVAASERPVIQTAFDLKADQIQELDPGHALIIKKNGNISLQQFKEAKAKRSCSFERIYFSRGTDQDIYNERKELGHLLSPAVLQAINYDLDNTVFSYIPNTAAVAYYGMTEALEEYHNTIKRDKIKQLGADISPEAIDEILSKRIRSEKVAVKDIKLRTFITEDNKRDDLVAHVYDITYGSLKAGMDQLVVLDDSIVRGTTLKQSIIRILDRLQPKKIVVASSAPQIRYPDCYGIDMAKIGDFIAFRAAISLLKETNQQSVINEVYRKCKAQEHLPKEEMVNYVKGIYKPLTADQISKKISELVTSPEVNAEVEVVFQSIENLHEALPGHKGDWYFTGDYPTPGGNKVVNKAFINYIEGKNIRAY